MNCKDFGYKALFVSYGVIAYLAIASGDLVGDVKTKLSTAGCLTASEFVFLLQNSMADLYMKLRSRVMA